MDELVSPSPLSSHDLMNMMAMRVSAFLGLLGSRRPNETLRVVYRCEGATGYRLVLTARESHEIEIDARCSDPLALGMFLDYLEREFEASLRAPHLHRLVGTIPTDNVS